MSNLVRSVFPNGAVAIANGPGSVAVATANGVGAYAEATAIGPGARASAEATAIGRRTGAYAEATAIGPGATANAKANEGQIHIVTNIGSDGINAYWNFIWPFKWSPFSYARGAMGYFQNRPPSYPPHQ